MSTIEVCCDIVCVHASVFVEVLSPLSSILMDKGVGMWSDICSASSVKSF